MRGLVVFVALVSVVAAKPWRPTAQGGRFVYTFDDSIEAGGYRDVSLEFVRPVNVKSVPSVGTPQASYKTAVATKTAGTGAQQQLYYGDSLEDLYYLANPSTQGLPRVERVKALTKTLGTGLVDFSEAVYQVVPHTAGATSYKTAAVGNKKYYVDESGELYYLVAGAHGGQQQQGAQQQGAYGGAGAGVHVAKK